MKAVVEIKSYAEQKMKVAVQSWALSASWIHGLIAQSVIASEQISVVMGSNPTHSNYL